MGQAASLRVDWGLRGPLAEDKDALGKADADVRLWVFPLKKRLFLRTEV